MTTVYMTSNMIAARYRISLMTLWRWENESPHLGFPKPIRINRRKYWAESEIDAWDRSKVMTPAASVVGLPGMSASVAINPL